MTWEKSDFMVKLLRVILRGSEVQISQLLAKTSRHITGDSEFPARLSGKIENAQNCHPNIVFGTLLRELWNLLVHPIFVTMNLKVGLT
jgi:hypothetical protein